MKKANLEEVFIELTEASASEGVFPEAEGETESENLEGEVADE